MVAVGTVPGIYTRWYVYVMLIILTTHSSAVREEVLPLIHEVHKAVYKKHKRREVAEECFFLLNVRRSCSDFINIKIAVYMYQL